MKKLLLSFLILCLLLTGCGLAPSATLPETPAVPAAASAQTCTDGLSVHYIDVGQADCTLLLCGGEAMLIDGGNVEDSQLVISYLQNQGVDHLEHMVCTHAHEDHVGGLPAVLAVYETQSLWCPVTEYDSKCFSDFLYYADQQELELRCPEPGTQCTLGSAEITFLGPVREDYDTNNSSIVLRVDYGETAFLFSGDAEREAETDILDAGYDISCTVLKAGHHGSSTSNSYRWLREANAEYVVIPVGADNSYGHPHDEVLSRFRDAGLTVYRTDLQGTILCTSDGKHVTFTTEQAAAVTNPTELDGSGQNSGVEYYIGNRNSKKLHFPTCSGLPEEQNQVRFDTLELAEAQGYTPCGRCMG